MQHTHARVAPQHVDSPYLSDLSPKDADWDKHRASTDKVSSLYGEAGMIRYAERAEGCSLWLQFQQQESGKFNLTGASFCKMRYCPACQWRRSLMWRGRFFRAIPDIIEENPTARWILLTLTVKNPPMAELRETLAVMNKAWKRLIERKDWPALGFVRATEITKGQDGNPHPHFHALLQVRPSYFGKNYIKHADWQRLWQECLRVDYPPVIDVRVIKEAEKTGAAPASMIAAGCEVLKYSTKPEDLECSAEFLAELTRQTFKLRFIATGGTLKTVLGKIEAESDDDLIHVDGEDVTDVPTEAPKVDFTWKREEKRYRRGKPDKAKIRQSNP